jgi:hypothetical protein
MNDLEAYVISYFGHDRMTAVERRVHKHLLSAQPLNEAEERLRDGFAWEEAGGRVIDEKVKSYLRRHHSGLSDDPEVLHLANGGLDVFYERTAKRILSEDRGKIFINSCPSCGALARTPKARQCRFCGHDWHGTPATHT